MRFQSKLFTIFFQIALILVLALVASPSLAAPQWRRFNPTSIYRSGVPRRTYYAAAPTPTTDRTVDLSNLERVYEASKPIVQATEELANDVFPNDGRPIVQGNMIRTKYGNAPLPAGNILDPNVRAELKELSDALKKVVGSERVDPQALNTVLEFSRDMQLSYY